MANVELYIQNGSVVYQPAVESSIKWETQRKGSPGKLTFKVVKDESLNIQEGNAVKMIVDGANVFFGYIFKKSRKNDGMIDITAYDQLRYFKNKDTYIYKGKTATQVLKMVCDDFNIKYGNVEETGYVIPKKKEDNKTLFDIVNDALSDTMLNTNKLYVLYDDFGRITLKNIASMKIPLIIDAETGQSFDYTSSIDGNTYNQIKLQREDSETGKRQNYIVKDSESINRWGVLQFFDKLNDGENGQEKASKLLEHYNKKTRNLKVSGAFGDVRVRAGTSPLIRLDLGDVIVDNFMVAESVTHTFTDGLHTMDLTLEGGDFVA